ncbi:hypothetical protein [Serinicoccus sediminis]|uniref:hypothetical protein n=1 Tax=Serinicoccus sediminis TaxID=2306021 RepID=UPI00101F2243|nr:hypothetical protein [Serinicoccus sediminis]
MDWWQVVLIPVGLALVPLVWKDFVSPRVNPAKDTPPKSAEPVVVGQPVEAVDYAPALVRSLTEQLTDERAQHDRCDALLAEHGLDVPHD